MIRFMILVSNVTFLDLGIFHDILVLNVCLKNEFFKSCFQQSAKSKMTAQTRRTYHVFSKNSINFTIGFATKTLIFKLPAPPPAFAFSLSN